MLDLNARVLDAQSFKDDANVMLSQALDELAAADAVVSAAVRSQIEGLEDLRAAMAVNVPAPVDAPFIAPGAAHVPIPPPEGKGLRFLYDALDAMGSDYDNAKAFAGDLVGVRGGAEALEAWEGLGKAQWWTLLHPQEAAVEVVVETLDLPDLWGHHWGTWTGHVAPDLAIGALSGGLGLEAEVGVDAALGSVVEVSAEEAALEAATAGAVSASAAAATEGEVAAGATEAGSQLGRAAIDEAEAVLASEPGPLGATFKVGTFGKPFNEVEQATADAVAEHFDASVHFRPQDPGGGKNPDSVIRRSPGDPGTLTEFKALMQRDPDREVSTTIKNDIKSGSGQLNDRGGGDLIIDGRPIGLTAEEADRGWRRALGEAKVQNRVLPGHVWMILGDGHFQEFTLG